MSDNEIKPVSWRWLDTCTFRKSIPKTATAGDWNPLYDQSAIDALTKQIGELKTMLSIAEFQRKEMQAERDEAFAAADSKAGWEWKKRAEKAEEERDAAVADAERYRWLRDKCNHIGGGLHIQFSSNASEADAAIDAARAQERQG